MTVLMKQTRQAVCAIKLSILLRCLCATPNWNNSVCYFSRQGKYNFTIVDNVQIVAYVNAPLAHYQRKF